MLKDRKINKDEKNQEFELSGAHSAHISKDEAEKMKDDVLTFGKVATRSSINSNSKLRNPEPKISLS